MQVAEHTGGGATQSVYREIHNQYADALQPWVNPLQRVQGIQAAGLLEPHPRPVVLAQQPYLAPVNPHQMCVSFPTLRTLSPVRALASCTALIRQLPLPTVRRCYWDHPQSLDNDNATQIIFKA